MSKILAFSGSFRKNSYNARIVWVAAEGSRRAGADVTLIDLTEFPMPILNPDDVDSGEFDPNALRFQKLLYENDGFIIASPEYNGSLPGGFKNAIDWASRANERFKLGEVFRGKYAAIMTASPGSFGGIRCLAHLRGILSMLQVHVHPTEIAVPFVRDKFDGDGCEMTDEKTRVLLEGLGASLAAFANRE